MSISQALPESDVLPGVWFIPRVERLALRDAQPDRSASAHKRQNGVERALQHLRAHGLSADASKSHALLILGGTSVHGVPEAPIFEEGFMISVEPDGTLLVVVTGPGPCDEVYHATDLVEATEKVVAVYRARQRAGGGPESPPEAWARADAPQTNGLPI
jgi:hypothetical protein